MRPGASTRERLVPLRESGRAEGDPDRATRAFRDDDRASLAPRGVGSVLDLGWEILSVRFLNCVGVALALTLPARVGLVAVRYSGVSRFNRQLLEYAIELMAPVLIAVMVANLVRDFIHGRSTSTWDSVRATLDRWPSLLAILGILAVGSGCFGYVFVCCFPIGLFVYWHLSIAPAVYAIERRSLTQVIPRGLRLLRGWASFGRFLGIVVVHALMFLGMTSAMVALDNPEIRATILEVTSFDSLTLDLLVTLPASIFSAISTAYLAIILTVYYYDVRARREGLDLELQLQEIEAELVRTTDSDGPTSGRSVPGGAL